MIYRRADSPSWKTAKEHGDDAELAVAELFKAHGCEVSKTLGQARFDLLVQSRLEIKNDLKAVETGNIAVEVSFRGKPSGIMDSSADRWIFVVCNMGYMIRTTKLRDLIQTGNFPIAEAGDGGLTRVRLVPLDFLRNLGFVQELNLVGGDDDWVS